MVFVLTPAVCLSFGGRPALFPASSPSSPVKAAGFRCVYGGVKVRVQDEISIYQDRLMLSVGRCVVVKRRAIPALSPVRCNR